MELLRIYLCVVFSCLLFSCYANGECDDVNDLKVNNDGSITDYYTYYDINGGDVKFKLAKMPCGTSSLGIHLIPKKDRAIAFEWRSLNNDSLNNDVIFAKVLDNTICRLQAKIQDFNNVSCANPSFSGQICYSRRKCDETCVSIIGGAFGSIAGGIILIMTAVILAHCCGRKGPSDTENIKPHNDSFIFDVAINENAITKKFIIVNKS
ncbi:9158_t:CDS:2 [Funneliformis geosporum]|uniref:8274_t:CDS:1 n=1 Tax=Funneliformis geosporum TaxID=1117311 RepID=A0A9W4SEU0_9GLOM|nr:8274_t:CDS:2 [Funneliformis geosporum]CAI2166715.1 9158_t:CDS:2 [Funneliformis geosporum]